MNVVIYRLLNSQAKSLNMKVTISVKGRFHAFFLAKELQKAGVLNQLITSYPVFKVQEYGVEKQFIQSLLFNELIERACHKLPFRFLKSSKANSFFHAFFDKRASRKIKNGADIFVGFSSSCLHTFNKLKNSSIKKIVENGSSHAIFQKKILEEEYGLFGLKYHHDPIMIEKKCGEYALADYISLPSQFTKNSFLEYGFPEKKIIQVPYGIDITKFYYLPKQDKKFRIIFCGNVGLRKGIQYLLKAFYELKLPNAELYIIGPVSPELCPFVLKYKADNIIWAGSFRENALVYEYAKGDVFCLPSIEEGLALVLPQAMACGLPVICTTHTGGDDIITNKKEGFILPIRNVDALKEKILLLYDNPELRKQMGMQALKTIHEKFTWAHYGEKMISAYHDILSSPL